MLKDGLRVSAAMFRKVSFLVLMLLLSGQVFSDTIKQKTAMAYQLLNTGNYKEAIELLEELYDNDNDNSNIRNTLATAYNNYATLLRASKDSASMAYYEKALDLSPNQPAVRYNFASELYDREKYEDAIYQLEYMYGKMTGDHRQQADMLLGLSYFKINDFSRAGYYFSEVDPVKIQDVSFYKGFVKYKLGEISEAISIWKEFAGRCPGLAQRFQIDNWIRKAETENRVEKEFSRDTTSHFLVKSDGDNSGVDLNFILTSFEEAYYDVGRELEIYPKNRIPVVIYSTHKQYQNATNSPEWTGGLWDGTKIRIPSTICNSGKELLKHTIFHEYVHLLLSTRYEKTYRNIPIWLNEGCAEYLSYSILKEDIKPIKLTKSAKEKLKLFYTHPEYFRNPVTAKNAYRLALHSVKFIVDRYGIKKLNSFIKNMARGSAAPFDEVLNCSMGQFIDDFIEFMK